MFDQKPTRSRATEIQYLKTARRLCLQALRELGIENCEAGQSAVLVVTWFLAAHGRWIPATIRVSRTAIAFFLEEALERARDKAQFEDALRTLNAGPMPTPRVGGSPRTSVRKRRSATIEELEAVLGELAGSRHPYAPIAYGLLAFGPELGLRPAEWLTATIDGDWLIVSNAKTTNGRGNGATRALSLAAFPEEFLVELRVFLERLADVTKTASRKDIVYPAARGQLHAACTRAGKRVASLRSKPLAFYTGRHIASRRAKSTMGRDAVGALLGHATDRASTTHYAKARSTRGWGPLLTTPSPEQVATVRPKFRAPKSAPVSAAPKI